jgi:putative ABC transport system permease protein
MFSRFAEGFSTSVVSIKSNKLRAFLTMLGVIIGVFSVVALISLGRGFQNYIKGEFDQLGSNLLFVAPGRSNVGGDPALSLTRNKLSKKHIDLITNYAPEHIAYAVPSINLNNDVSYKGKEFLAEILGSTHEMPNIFNYQIDTGRFFSKSEVTSKARLAVIGPNVADELFSGVNPIGRSVIINEKSFNVIGVFKEKSPDYDNQVLTSYTALESTFDIKRYTYIVLKLKDNAPMEIAKKQVELALLRDLEEDDFSVLSQEDILATVQQILGILTTGLGALAAISLLVGGIGIMNIMLVTVTERTKEVGLRMALGATKLDIAFQFLIEAVLISVLGGIVGLILAYLLSLGLSQFIQTEVPPMTIFLSFLFSVAVGVVFGTYPAISASKKEPIEALRYE